MRTLYSSALIVALLLMSFTVGAQQTIVLQPDAGAGKDALIQMRNSDTTIAAGNNGSEESFEAVDWTWGGDPGLIRSLLEFNLSLLPPGATISDARLTLYNNPTSHESNGEHQSLSGSNEAVLQRITSAWQEDSVTWNNQPTTTNQNEVVLPQSTSLHEDYLNIDVTALVTDMAQNPSSSFGFLIKEQTESYYRSMIFASSDNANCSLHPMLVITYTSPDPITTITLKPDSLAGKDALIQMRNGDPTAANGNLGDYQSFEANAWTWGGDPGLMRSLLEFDLSSIPPNATVTDAKLTLYNDSTSHESNGEHHSLSGSDESLLQRITSNWTENTVTWNNQPTTTNQHEVLLAQSTSLHEDYMDINVTDLVKDMTLQPASSFGFMLKLATEQYYRCLIFASSDHPNCNLHPRLQVTYTLATGIEELSGDVFSVYPNPGTGQFSLSWNSSQQEFNKIKIVDILGQTILESKLPPSNSNSTTFDISQSAKGVYFVILEGKNIRAVNKLILE